MLHYTLRRKEKSFFFGFKQGGRREGCEEGERVAAELISYVNEWRQMVVPILRAAPPFLRITLTSSDTRGQQSLLRETHPACHDLHATSAKGREGDYNLSCSICEPYSHFIHPGCCSDEKGENQGGEEGSRERNSCVSSLMKD